MYSTSELYEKILIHPATEGADVLRIVSGFASHAMASHHIEQIIQRNIRVKKIELLIGMTPLEGVSDVAHRGFVELCRGIGDVQFDCSYVTGSPPVHSKAYCWTKNGKPTVAFVGSCNYTQNAFIRGQREIYSQASHENVSSYIDSLIGESIFCHHQDANRFSEIYHSRHGAFTSEEEIEGNQPDDSYFAIDERFRGLESVEISLTERTGSVPSRSGLNWGQRNSRNPNQAYLSIRGDAKKTDFFPPIGEHFTVLTDDGASLVCSRAQQGGKAIHTPHDNSKIGEYFRRRLNVADGEFVTREHLEIYGRHCVKFYKIDDENYYMDFSAS